MSRPSRRDVLAGVGSSASVALAGCLDALDDEDEAPDPDNGYEAGMVVDVSQEELLQIQQEVQQEVEEGELDEEEMQDEIQQRQLELIDTRMDDAESSIDDAALDVEDRFDDLGVILVVGDAGAMIEMLDGDAIGSIVSAAEVRAVDEEPDPEEAP